jgi:hypothetical protein
MMRQSDCRHRILIPRLVSATVTISLLLLASFFQSGSANVRNRIAHDQESAGATEPALAGAATKTSLNRIDELHVESEISRPSRHLSEMLMSDKEGSDQRDEMINVIVGFKERSHIFLRNQSNAYSRVSWPTGLPVTHKISRINAEVVRIVRKDMQLLTNDPDVAYVEEDGIRYLASETVPWGIPAIQANGTQVPAPDKKNFEPDERCFNICIIDTGIHLTHPDLVRNAVLEFSISITLGCVSFSFLIASRDWTEKPYSTKAGNIKGAGFEVPK